MLLQCQRWYMPFWGLLRHCMQQNISPRIPAHCGTCWGFTGLASCSRGTIISMELSALLTISAVRVGCCEIAADTQLSWAFSDSACGNQSSSHLLVKVLTETG